MPYFNFEIAPPDAPPAPAGLLSLSDYRAAWCHTEYLASRLIADSAACIRVKDVAGRLVIQTGVATALASIQKCRRTACPLKRTGAVPAETPLWS